MMTFERSASLTALVLIIAGGLVLAGCGGGDDGGGGGAGSGTITGSISYANTGQPLGGITVTAGGRVTQTNSSGAFTLTGVPAGAQVLIITADASRGLAVPPGADLRVNVPDGGTVSLPAPILLIDATDVPPNPPA